MSKQSFELVNKLAKKQNLEFEKICYLLMCFEFRSGKFTPCFHEFPIWKSKLFQQWEKLFQQTTTTTKTTTYKTLVCLLKAECYKELYYRPHSGTRFRRFGPFWPGGQNGKISETTEFLLKYATFSGGFLPFRTNHL